MSDIVMPQIVEHVGDNPAAEQTKQPVDLHRQDGNKSRIWIQAYDRLLQEEPLLVAAYEKTLEKLHGASQMGREASAHVASSTSADDRADVLVNREEKMSQYIETGLQRTEKEARVKGKLGDVLAIINTVRDIVGQAVQAAPQAALPWVGICFALEVRFPAAKLSFLPVLTYLTLRQMLMNPISESAAQRSGLQHILSRMQWYQSLTDVLFEASRGPATADFSLGHTLETGIVQLYVKFLTYVMKSVRVYHQNRVLITLRDFVKYDDWATQLDDIKQAEEAIRKDTDMFLSLRSSFTPPSSNNEVLSHAMADMAEAFQGWKKTQEDEECAKLISGAVASMTRQRILDKKGRLFESCCDWFFESRDFQAWRDDPAQKVLLVSGDPGKGKTMLLCSLVDWFEHYRGVTYFFCLAEDSSTNNQKAVLKGLIREITQSIPELFQHVQRNKDELQLEGPSGELALFNTLKAIIEDPLMTDGIIVIDALDECKECNSGREGLATKDRILQLVAQTSQTGVKWILSSRNYLTPTIRRRIGARIPVLPVDLDHILPRKAVQEFVRLKMKDLSERLGDDFELDPTSHQDVEIALVSKAEGTYLYVSLVLDDIQRELEEDEPLCSTAEFIRKRVDSKPKSLFAMYEAMMTQICREKKSAHYQDIIRLVFLAERPLSLRELQYLAQDRGLRQVDDLEKLKRIFRQGSSFLSIEKDAVSFIHQSARDFVSKRGWKGEDRLLACPDLHEAHWDVFTTSLDILSSILRRDIYNLGHPGTSMVDMKRPDPDPLAPCLYSAVHLANHLMASTCRNHRSDTSEKLSDFFSKHLLHWVEALSLAGELGSCIATLRSVREWMVPYDQHQKPTVRLYPVYFVHGACMTSKTKADSVDSYQINRGLTSIDEIIDDALKSLLQCRAAIEVCPLQVYTSLLIFSPASSTVGTLFAEDRPSWLTSPEKVATVQKCCTIIIDCPLYTWRDQLCFANHDTLSSVYYSDLRGCSAAHVWDTSTGISIVDLPSVPKSYETATRGPRTVSSISTDGMKMIAPKDVQSDECNIHLWDASQGSMTVFNVKGQNCQSISIALSPNGRYVLAGPIGSSVDCKLNIWDSEGGDETTDSLPGNDRRTSHRFMEYGRGRSSLAFLSDTLFASTNATSVFVQDIYGDLVKTIETGFAYVEKPIWHDPINQHPKLAPVTSGHCSAHLVPRFALWNDTRVEIWNLHDEKPLLAHEVEAEHTIEQLAISANGKTLVLPTRSSRSRTQFIDVWTLDGVPSRSRLETRFIDTPFGVHLALSQDGALVAFELPESQNTIEIWSLESLHVIHKLRGHTGPISSMVFSPDGLQLASRAQDGTIRLWKLEKLFKDCLATQPQPFDRGTGLYHGIRFSPNGKYFVTRQHNGTIALWSDRGTQLALFPGVSKSFSGDGCCIFSPDSRILVDNSMASDGTWAMTIRIIPQRPETEDPSTWIKLMLPSRRRNTAVISKNCTQMAIHEIDDDSSSQTLTVFSLDLGTVAAGIDVVSSWKLQTESLQKMVKGDMAMVFLEDGCLACGTVKGDVMIFDRSGNATARARLHGILTIQTLLLGNQEFLIVTQTYDDDYDYEEELLSVLDVTNHYEITRVRSMDIQGPYELIPEPTVPWCFHTRRGVLDLREEMEGNSKRPTSIKRLSGVALSNPRDNSETLFQTNQHGWVIQDGQRLLWIPPDHRPRRLSDAAVFGSKIVFQSAVGELLIFNFC